MPRVSREQTEKNRAAIETASAKLFKQHGLNGVSVADLMAAAGLTHGGFYGHFASKDELAAAACAKSFEHSAARWSARIAAAKDTDEARAVIVGNYLTAKSRDEPGSSCGAVALAADVAREPRGKPVRAVYLSGVKSMRESLEILRADADSGCPNALVQLSIMVGALTLARATRGDAISDEFLSAARDFLLAPRPDARKRVAASNPSRKARAASRAF